MEYDKERIELQRIEGIVDLHGKNVLEVGCGGGRVTSLLVDKTETLVAIDPDCKCIDEAKTNVERAYFNIGSGERLGFKNESFDLVFFTFSLHHQESTLALQEAHRVLKPNGQVIIIEPAPDCKAQYLWDLFEDETQALENALDAIETSNFLIEHKDIFFTNAIFKNKEEVYSCYFDWHNVESDERMIKKMNDILGEQVHMRPVNLEVKLLLFSLRKKNRHYRK